MDPTVAGPVSTGGRGSIKANLHLLSKAIDLLYSRGIHVFDQSPYEEKVQTLKLNCTHNGYHMKILDDLYKPIYESGNISAMYFLPGWASNKAIINLFIFSVNSIATWWLIID